DVGPSDGIGVAPGDHARIVAHHTAEVVLIDEVTQDSTRLEANVAVFPIGRRHADYPPLDEFLGMARIGPLAKLFGGHQGFGGRHRITSFGHDNSSPGLSPISRPRSI